MRPLARQPSTSSERGGASGRFSSCFTSGPAWMPSSGDASRPGSLIAIVLSIRQPAGRMAIRRQGAAETPSGPTYCHRPPGNAGTSCREDAISLPIFGMDRRFCMADAPIREHQPGEARGHAQDDPTAPTGSSGRSANGAISKPEPGSRPSACAAATA